MRRSHSRKSVDSIRDEHEKLLEKALARPGVKDLFSVYDAWRQIEEASRPHFSVMSTYRAAISNASMPFSAQHR